MCVTDEGEGSEDCTEREWDGGVLIAVYVCLCVCKVKKAPLFALEPRVHKNFSLENLNRLQTSFATVFPIDSYLVRVHTPINKRSPFRFVSFCYAVCLSTLRHISCVCVSVRA